MLTSSLLFQSFACLGTTIIWMKITWKLTSECSHSQYLTTWLFFVCQNSILRPQRRRHHHRRCCRRHLILLLSFRMDRLSSERVNANMLLLKINKCMKMSCKEQKVNVVAFLQVSSSTFCCAKTQTPNGKKNIEKFAWVTIFAFTFRAHWLCIYAVGRSVFLVFDGSRCGQ